MSRTEIPRIVSIETTNRCNAKCSFCPNSSLARNRQTMAQDLFEKIIDDCTKFQLPAIEPFLNGEPLCDPNLLERLEHIRKRLPNTELRLYTNGYALTPAKQDALADIGVDHLFISLNTLDAGRYEKITGLSLEKTLDNLDYLSNHPQRQRIARKLTIRMTRLDDTPLEEQEKFNQFCVEKNAIPFIAALYNYKGDINSALPVPNFPCANITRVDILASGTVTLCCMDQEGEYSWGDVRNESVLDIYNNLQARLVKQAHRSGNRKNFPPCNICNYCSPSFEKTGIIRRLRFKTEKRNYWQQYKPRGMVAPR
ncbi:MAG: radical SAM protein [Deltaproteobacteria bacterium]|nr:radical SAM protein [Deltaproteobacteria bacterium]